jgi:hypothetical protein
MGILLEARCAETPFYEALKRTVRALIRFELPFWHAWGLSVRAMCVSQRAFIEAFRRLLAVIYYGPIFKSRRWYLSSAVRGREISRAALRAVQKSVIARLLDGVLPQDLIRLGKLKTNALRD